MKPRRCQQIVGEKLCGLKALGVLDGKPPCSQHMYHELSKRKAA